MGNAQYKLYYFEFKFRAETIRFIFEAAGKPYEDIRFAQSKWPEYKNESPFGTAPYLEISNGSQTLKLGESIAIARYVARKFKLAGKSDEESAIVDMYADLITDLMNQMVRIFVEKDEDKKKQEQDKLQNELVPKCFQLFEDRIAQSKSGYFVPSGLTWVDLYLFNFIDIRGDKVDDLLNNNCKHVKKLYENVRTNPRIAAYLKRRPVTPF
uniref:Glutathione S-transferase S4 n=1 Tax=Brachionus koreanus TaxID=1199090 RepID=A0A3G2JSJ0_9BILA|nr:glutathione S-transferase S4 [Brachionus koreanus]